MKIHKKGFEEDLKGTCKKDKDIQEITLNQDLLHRKKNNIHRVKRLPAERESVKGYKYSE